MYQFVLFLHSWLRWMVLAAALYAVVRALSGRLQDAAFERRDQRAHGALTHLANLQFVLGLLLYLWLSPIVRSAFADMGAAMRSAPLRFFAVEHITAMVIALGVLHTGRARTRRATSDAVRHKASLFGSAGFLLCALIGVPWPFLKQGRPLLRLSLDGSAAAVAEPELYRKRCAACHGASGRGDGLAATSMTPRPRDLTDPMWQKRVSDAELTRVIREGGLARKLSTNMPPHTDLSSRQLVELVRFIRALAHDVPESDAAPSPRK